LQWLSFRGEGQKGIENDKTLSIHAATQAQKASDYITRRKGGEQVGEISHKNGGKL